MRTIFYFACKKAFSDPYLIFWSVFFPIANVMFFSMLINVEGYILHILTAMMCMSVLSYSFMTTAFRIVINRKRGLYNLLKLTPMPLHKYIMSVSLAWTTISILSSLTVLFICALIFEITFPPISIVPIVLALFIASLGYIFLAFFTSSLVKEMGHASIINNIVLMGSMFLSNAYYTLDAAPPLLKLIVKINPFYYFINAVRNALFLQWNNYFNNIIMLVIFSVVVLFLASKTFRYTDK